MIIFVLPLWLILAPGQEERRGTVFPHPGMRWLRSTKTGKKPPQPILSSPVDRQSQHLEKKRHRQALKSQFKARAVARVAPGMLQWQLLQLLLALEFPAGSKVRAAAPTLLKRPFSAGKTETGEVTARKAGGGKAGESSAHGEVTPAPWIPWQEPPEHSLHPFHPRFTLYIALFSPPEGFFLSPHKLTEVEKLRSNEAGWLLRAAHSYLPSPWGNHTSRTTQAPSTVTTWHINHDKYSKALIKLLPSVSL